MEHHAYIYEGPLSHVDELERDARMRFGFTAEHNPDVVVRVYEKFGIDEARALSETASLKSISGRALCVVGVGSATSEAQQALLKLFEEPQQGTVFVLLTPHGGAIPTLRSRTLPYPAVLKVPVSGSTEARAFLAAAGKARSDEIAKMLKDEDGARERVRGFLNALERELYAAAAKSKRKKELYEGLEDIARARGYTGDRSPSFKMLLEHIVLSLPTLK